MLLVLALLGPWPIALCGYAAKVLTTYANYLAVCQRVHKKPHFLLGLVYDGYQSVLLLFVLARHWLGHNTHWKGRSYAPVNKKDS